MTNKLLKIDLGILNYNIPQHKAANKLKKCLARIKLTELCTEKETEKEK